MALSDTLWSLAWMLPALVCTILLGGNIWITYSSEFWPLKLIIPIPIILATSLWFNLFRSLFGKKINHLIIFLHILAEIVYSGVIISIQDSGEEDSGRENFTDQQEA